MNVITFNCIHFFDPLLLDLGPKRPVISYEVLHGPRLEGLYTSSERSSGLEDHRWGWRGREIGWFSRINISNLPSVKFVWIGLKLRLAEIVTGMALTEQKHAWNSRNISVTNVATDLNVLDKLMGNVNFLFMCTSTKMCDAKSKIICW